jgi:hypothetical protein
MIPHFIVNEKTGHVLQFTFDFKKLTTILTLQKPLADGFEVLKEIPIDDILRYGVSHGNHWYVATMKIRKWGAPAFIEEWSWETLSVINKYPIEHDRFGLTNFSLSPKGDMVVINRFHEEANPDESGCKIFSFPDLIEVARVPINANLQSPTFDATGNKLVLIHTDQGSAETMLFEKKGEGFEKVVEFAENQITADMTYTAVTYTTHGIAILSLSFKSELGLYDINTGQCKFLIEVEKSLTNELEDLDPDFSYEHFTDTILGNTDLTIFADNTHVYVGSTGKIFKINLSSGVVDDTIDVPGLLYIVQLRKLNHELIVVDHIGNLGKVTLR